MSDAGNNQPARAAAPLSQTARRRLGAGISTALMLGSGLVVCLAVAGVLLVSLWSAQRNTVDILSATAELHLTTLVEQVRNHFDPVREGNAFLAGLMARGEVDPRDHVQLVDYMTGAMAATPQVRGMGFIDPSHTITRAVRSKDRIAIRLSDWSEDPATAAMMENAVTRSRPHWGAPFWSEDARTTLLDRRAPIWRNGRFLGVLLTTVSIIDLSRDIARATFKGIKTNRFILYGSDHVFAHRAMSDGKYQRSDRHPLPALAQIGDAVLANIWNAATRRTLQLPLGAETSGHGVAVGGEVYMVLFRQIEGYSSAPLRVGAYLRHGAAGVGQETNRLILSGVVGLLILLVSVSAALYLGRAMSRRMRDLTRAAESVRGFDLDHAPQLDGSRLRELDEASSAFNSMVTGLKRFETYVPRGLVSTLAGPGGPAEITAEERPVTVLFTDIHAFTGLAQDMTAAETATFLNRHFALVTDCVEAEDGIVDRSVGDKVMAFWGAPIADADGVAQACRAALDIRRAIAADNESRGRRGALPIRLRIGIHTGPAVVGNFGAPGRITYSLVGDAVNVAQRLQQLGGEFGSGGAVEILVSAEIANRLDGEFQLSPQGSQPFPGRHDMVGIYRLD
jgi:class 3 adenylate cyclase